MFGKSKDKKPAECTILNNRFSMKIPPEWEENTVYTYEGPLEDGIKHNILINIDNNVEITNLEKYADMQIRATENELQGYHELKRECTKLDNEHPAYEWVYKWCPLENTTIYQKVLFILSSTTGYILTASFSKKTFKMMGSEVDRILKSFTIPQT